MATPFSPFVGRIKKPALKRRQSELPSDLIDWEAPEIPELEKQRIIYDDYIREMKEDHEIESLLNEQIFLIAHDTIVDEYQSRIKTFEEQLTKESSRVNLLLGQMKMFEENVKENEDRTEELENELASQRETILALEQEKENWIQERTSMQMEIENLNFRNNETTCELNNNLEIYIQKKNEVEDYKKKLDAVKNQLTYYKRMAKNKDNNDD